MNTKVAMLGKLSTKFKAPFDNPGFDIWTLNFHTDRDLFPRIDLWFDIHANANNPYANITRDNYPFDEVEKLLGGNYFNNTVSYMIAYAILNSYKEIWLYGMKFQSNEEKRKLEYHNVRELLFFAKGRGIKVFAPYDRIMLQGYRMYGIPD